MTTSADALRTVADALDALAEALASGSPDRVLAAEEPLAHAVRQLTTVPPPIPTDRPRVRVAARAVRLAIARCDRLGRVSADIERLMRGQPAYGPASAAGAWVISTLGSRS